MQSPEREKKRFIAGATCTECKAIDTLMLYTSNGVEHVECTECGFHMVEPKSQGHGSERTFDGVIGVFKPD